MSCIVSGQCWSSEDVLHPCITIALSFWRYISAIHLQSPQMRSCLEGMGRAENSIQLQDKRTSWREEENSQSKTLSGLDYNQVFHGSIFCFSFCDMTRNSCRFRTHIYKEKWPLNFVFVSVKAGWFVGSHFIDLWKVIWTLLFIHHINLRHIVIYRLIY